MTTKLNSRELKEALERLVAYGESLQVDSKALIISAKLRSFNLYLEEDRQDAIKKYLLFCLQHKDKTMRIAAQRVINKEFPHLKETFEKYLILL